MSGARVNHKPYGETYACCKHCEDQACDPPNQHLSGCSQGCGTHLYTLSTIAEAVEVAAESDTILSYHRAPDRQGVYRLMFNAQKRGRWFW